MLDTIHKILVNKGFQISKLRIDNFRGTGISPIESLYQTKANKVLLSMPVDKCRTQLWNTLEITNNPFVKTLKDYSIGKIDCYKGSEMEEYYNEYQPETAAEVLRLPNNSNLKEMEALSFILPWDNMSSVQAKTIRENNARNENKLQGKNIGLDFGYTEFGPLSSEKGDLEFKRLVGVYQSISNNGYKEDYLYNDGGIRGYFLLNKQDYCFIVTAGKHRSYALSALGYKEIPIVIDLNFNSIYYSESKSFWLNVRNSVFTVDDVDLLFKNLLFLPSESL